MRRAAALTLAGAALCAPAAASGDPGDRLPGEPDSSPGPTRARARAFHGSVAAGGALLLTGDGGDRLRYEVSADVKLGRRLGVLAAWRAPDGDHRGLVTAGISFEAGAARPRLVVDLHADAGADLDARAPLAGGGIRTTLAITGALGIVLDAGAYLVLDGVDDTRLQIQSSTLVALCW